MPRQTLTLNRNAAELLAIEALSYLAEDPEKLGRFLALTGVSPGEIRAQAHEPAFLGAVLDHIAGDESLLLAFAGASGRNPLDIARARAKLGGPAWEAENA